MPKDCLNTYSVTKSFGEEFFSVYTKMYGIETIIFRYFNVYGDREPLRGPYSPVIGLFIRQFKADQPLTIVGDGEQRRDFTHINDVVQANILAMTVKLEQYGEIFNIGNGKNYSINEIADMISDKRESLPLRIGEARETLANNTKARTLLGWEPVGSIKDYIEDSLNFIEFKE
jgi:UDP-glucose 4-epimerase